MPKRLITTCELYIGNRSELPCGHKAVAALVHRGMNGAYQPVTLGTGVCRKHLNELQHEGYFKQARYA